MSNVIVKSNRYTVEPLYQWDLNQVLTIYGLSLASIPEIHFTNTGMDRAIVKQATMDDAGVIRADVPNSLLQKPYTITAYVCIYEGDTFKSLYAIEIPVKARKKPGDYTLENDEESYSFNALENQIVNLMNLIEDHNQVDDELSKKYGNLDSKYENAKKDLDNKFTQLNKSVSDNFNHLNKNVTDQLDGFSKDLGYLKTYVTPEMFGAVGDGVTDDSEAILNTIKYASDNNIYRVLFTKLYRVDNTITLTNLRQDKDSKPIFLECNDGNPFKCCIIGNTGGKVFNFVNCHFIKLRLNIVSSLYEHTQFSNLIPVSDRKGCSIGICITRATEESSTHTFDVGGHIMLHHDTSLNAGYGTVALYNDTCEMINYQSCVYYADTPIIITTKDLLGVTDNPYNLSCKDHYFIGRNFLQSYGNENACIIIDGAINVSGSLYGYCVNGTENSSFMRLMGYLQNVNLMIDCEFTGSIIDGISTISYGVLNISSAGSLKGIKDISLNNVILFDNMMFKDTVDRVILEIANNRDVTGCTIYAQYATTEKPRIINNNGILCNTQINPSCGTVDNTVKVVNGENVLISNYIVNEGTLYGYGKNNNNRMVGWSYSKPTKESGDGTLFINYSDVMATQVGHPAFWIRKGDEYIPLCQVGYRIFEASNLANITPRFIGEFIIDTDNKLHMATGTTAGAWTV